MNPMIFVTEDEEDIREILRCTVESFGYDVKTFATAEELLNAIQEEVPSLVLLDVMLPGMDGIEALQYIKANVHTKKVPVILLTARSGELDKVRGLDNGADDYITKPFGVLELSARIRTALRRTETQTEVPHQLKGEHVLLDVDNREVSVGGKSIELTLKEFELLKILMQSGNLVKRDELLDKVWGYDYIGESRTLDMHVKTLRSKLGDDAENPRFIKTVRGVGYRFID